MSTKNLKVASGGKFGFACWRIFLKNKKFEQTTSGDEKRVM